MIHGNTQAFCHRLTRRANAWAAIRGEAEHPGLLGTVKFYQTPAGVLVLTEIWGLPTAPESSTGFFGFHIHESRDCREPGSHFNPADLPHPQHMGDLPPLTALNGYAWTAFLTTRFTIREIMGHVVIIHAGPDDFTTQPSGNAGKIIACGKIC